MPKGKVLNWTPPSMGYASQFKFGKYKGKTLEQVIDEAPAYLMWALENEVFTLDHGIESEALELINRSRGEK